MVRSERGVAIERGEEEKSDKLIGWDGVLVRLCFEVVDPLGVREEPRGEEKGVEMFVAGVFGTAPATGDSKMTTEDALGLAVG